MPCASRLAPVLRPGRIPEAPARLQVAQPDLARRRRALELVSRPPRVEPPLGQLGELTRRPPGELALLLERAQPFQARQQLDRRAGRRCRVVDVHQPLESLPRQVVPTGTNPREHHARPQPAGERARLELGGQHGLRLLVVAGENESPRLRDHVLDAIVPTDHGTRLTPHPNPRFGEENLGEALRRFGPFCGAAWGRASRLWLGLLRRLPRPLVPEQPLEEPPGAVAQREGLGCEKSAPSSLASTGAGRDHWSLVPARTQTMPGRCASRSADSASNMSRELRPDWPRLTTRTCRPCADANSRCSAAG